MESWKDWFRQRFLLLKSKEWFTRDPFLREVSNNAYAHSQFTVLSNSALVLNLKNRTMEGKHNGEPILNSIVVMKL